MKRLTAALIALLMLAGIAPAMAETTAAGALPIATEPISLTIGLMPNATVTDYEDNHYTQYLEEQTGIDISFYFFPSTAGEASQKLELMVSSGQKLPDIIVGVPMSDAAKLSYGQQGVILDLAPFFEAYGHFFYESSAKWCSEMDLYNMETYSRAADGKQYTFPILYADPGNMQQGAFYINQTWLDALGLPIPDSLEALEETLIAFRDEDPNGNGLKDEIPAISATYSGITPHDVATILINSYVYYNPRYPMNVDSGVVYAPFVTDAWQEALRYANKLFNEGLISTLSFTQDSTQLKSILGRGDTGEDIVVGAFVGHPGSVFDANSQSRMNYVSVPPIEGPEGIAYSPLNPSGLTYNNVITKDCQYPEAAFRLLDFMCDEYTSMVSRWGREGEDWIYTAADDPRACRYASIGCELYYAYTNNPYASENNLIWKCDSISFLPAKLFGAMPMPHTEGATEANYSSEMYAKSVGERWGKNPPALVTRLIYTEDELEIVNEVETSINDYVEECKVRFVMGDMDIEKDWQGYKDTLYSMGLETYVEIVQDAYARMTEE